MHWLLFELAAPLASFGGVAPGTVRDTELLPSRSALLGLLAAACGIERDDVEGQRTLGDGLLLAARANAEAPLLRDYHTAQAPEQAALKGYPCRTRRDELAVRKDKLSTVLSDRYYHATYAATIGVACGAPARLEVLEQALRRPRFTLYLGRKSCPLAWPLDPHRLEAETWTQALALHDTRMAEQIGAFERFGVEKWLRSPNGRYVHCGDDAIAPGELAVPGHVVTRRDQPLDTARRLFGERRHWRCGQEVQP